MIKEITLRFYYTLHTYFRTHTPRVYGALYQKKKIAKYIISGGMATIANIVVLYTLTNFLGVYYLVSSILAFVVSIIVSFTLQKFWTFENTSKDAMRIQFILYSIVVFTNLVLNTFIVYVSVQWLSLSYLLAQLIAGIVVAIVGFFAYRNLVFRH